MSLLPTTPTYSDALTSTASGPVRRIMRVTSMRRVRMGIVMVRVVMRSSRVGSLEGVGGLGRAIELEGEWSVT